MLYPPFSPLLSSNNLLADPNPRARAETRILMMTTTTTLIVDQQQTSSRITLTLQQSFNQQPLTCVAENPRIPQSSAMRQTIKLDVHCKFSVLMGRQDQYRLSAPIERVSWAALLARERRVHSIDWKPPSRVAGFQMTMTTIVVVLLVVSIDH